MRAIALVSKALSGFRVVVVRTAGSSAKWKREFFTMEEVAENLRAAGFFNEVEPKWKQSEFAGVTTLSSTDVSLKTLLKQGFLGEE